jgi:hypothetical protein
MRNRKLGFWLGAFFFIFTLSIASTLEAQSLAVIPTKVRLSVLPGSLKSGTIKLENGSEASVTVRVYLEDWQYDQTHTGTKEFKPAASLPLSCANWISFAPAEFTIPPFGRQIVGFTVNVPKDASGGYYAVLFFETALGKQQRPGTSKEEGVTINVLGRVGTLFYIEPEGTIKKEVNLSNFKVVRTESRLPLEITLDLENTGNIDITSGGTFHIMDNQGIIYARNEFNDVYTFPGEKAKVKAGWKEPIPRGKYDLVITLDLGKALEELGLGRGPVLTKETEIEIGVDGSVVKVGELD